MEMTCGNCGRTFSIPAAWVRKGAGRFCSRECYTAHQRLHPHTARGKVAHPRVERVCEQCGATFLADKRRSDQRVCSWACRQALLRVERVCPICGTAFRTTVRHPGLRYCSEACLAKSKEIYAPCQRCGTIFLASRSGNHDVAKYCSDDCHWPPTMQTCATCGKEFRVGPSDFARRKFCSFRCYRHFSGETEPERGARLCLEHLGLDFRQEYVVPGWRYPVDFHIPALSLMLEIDGTYWHRSPRVQAQDARKTLWLQRHGFKVVRLPDLPFYGPVSEPMVAYLRAALNLAEHAPTATNAAGLYPIQLALPLD